MLMAAEVSGPVLLDKVPKGVARGKVHVQPGGGGGKGNGGSVVVGIGGLMAKDEEMRGAAGLGIAQILG